MLEADEIGRQDHLLIRKGMVSRTKPGARGRPDHTADHS